jgi:hypothetical protein
MSRRKRKLAVVSAEMPAGKLERISGASMDAKHAHLDALMHDSPGPSHWEALFEMLDSADVPADFLTERQDGPAQGRKTL